MPYKDKTKQQEYMQSYNKTDKQKEWKQAKTICECGRSVSRRHFAEHLKSAIHKSLTPVVV